MPANAGTTGVAAPRRYCRGLALAVVVAACSGGERGAANVARDSVAGEHTEASRTTIGQWIWSRTDSATFATARRAMPNLVPTVWIGTIASGRDGDVRSQLALSPRLAGTADVTVVVRFEDSFSTVFAHAGDSAVAAATAAKVRSLLTAARATGVRVTELQLDYDCPERLLPRWARVIERVARDDSVGGTPLWVTSVVAHVRQQRYGDLFRGSVQGHILQVFDTGDVMTTSHARQIEQLASRQRLPFRLGVAAFERALASGRTTEHRAWFAATRVMAESEWYRGVWVFPGGRSWSELVNR